MSKKYTFKKQDFEIIQDFVDTINEDILVQKGTRYECEIDNDIIFISNKRLNQYDLFFNKWLVQQTFYKNVKVPNIIMSILHEIGHIMTKGQTNYEDSKFTIGIHQFMYEMGVINAEELQINYFNTPLEYLATEWGYNYFYNHQEQCNQLAIDLKLED